MAFKASGVEVKVTGVSKRYKTAAEEVQALHPTDWEVGKGSAVAIMGPSGCGKTTLLNLLGGVDRPTGGKIIIEDQDVSAMNERALENYRLMKVGFVFQFYNLIPSLSAFENVELPMVMAHMPESKCRERARAMLSLVGLEHKGQ